MKVEVENAKTTYLALKNLQVEIKELQEEEKRLLSGIDKEKKENEVKSYVCCKQKMYLLRRLAPSYAHSHRILMHVWLFYPVTPNLSHVRLFTFYGFNIETLFQRLQLSLNELNVQKENLDAKNKELEKNLDEETKKVNLISQS